MGKSIHDIRLSEFRAAEFLERRALLKEGTLSSSPVVDDAQEKPSGRREVPVTTPIGVRFIQGHPDSKNLPSPLPESSSRVDATVEKNLLDAAAATAADGMKTAAALKAPAIVGDLTAREAATLDRQKRFLSAAQGGSAAPTWSLDGRNRAAEVDARISEPLEATQPARGQADSPPLGEEKFKTPQNRGLAVAIFMAKFFQLDCG